MGQTMEQFRASFMPQAEKQVNIDQLTNLVLFHRVLVSDALDLSGNFLLGSLDVLSSSNSLQSQTNLDQMCIRDRCRVMWMASTTSWSVPMGCVFARTASIEPLKPIKINNLGWQLCQERVPTPNTNNSRW